MRAVISHDDTWKALLFAMRHVIGGRTSAPEDIAAMIAAESQVATPTQCRQMAMHIRDESEFLLRNRIYDRENGNGLPPEHEMDGITEFTDLLPTLEERARERE